MRSWHGLPSGNRHTSRNCRLTSYTGGCARGPETYERKSDADRALVMIEAQIRSGEWTDPERGKVKLADYGSAWITERPGLRPRTMDLYRWLLHKHIEPYLGGVPVGKLSTRQVREWRATLLANGVSVSVTAKAYRLLRAILTTAVDGANSSAAGWLLLQRRTGCSVCADEPVSGRPGLLGGVSRVLSGSRSESLSRAWHGCLAGGSAARASWQ